MFDLSGHPSIVDFVVGTSEANGLQKDHMASWASLAHTTNILENM
jgi:hypothetical protein